jgi:uncharacterized protein
MQINLLEFLSHIDKTKIFQCDITMESFQCKLGTFPVNRKEPFSLEISNSGDKKIAVKGEIEVFLIMLCDRCLEEVEVPIRASVNRVFDLKKTEEERIADLDETVYLERGILDTDKLVYSEILLNLPMKVLCSEDCKGICNRCGTNLNHGTCDCDIAELDPRMSVIRDIFNNFKEV